MELAVPGRVAKGTAPESSAAHWQVPVLEVAASDWHFLFAEGSSVRPFVVLEPASFGDLQGLANRSAWLGSAWLPSAVGSSVAG